MPDAENLTWGGILWLGMCVTWLSIVLWPRRNRDDR